MLTEYLRGAIDADLLEDFAVNPLDYHVLLAMARAPLWGYAIKDAIESESGGALAPRAGTLYRILARLIGAGLVREADPPGATQPHPGRERKYYALSTEGREALAAEARRLRDAAALAERRLGTAEGRL